ncbi:flagellar protein FlaG [Paenibacillus sp. FSL R5-0744]|uniref:flagellar protein FlaG n=1 Tax=Paenibacillus sp. FSL R5-0744 TaxID=2921656 RepID=UPI0030DB4CBA
MNVQLTLSTSTVLKGQIKSDALSTNGSSSPILGASLNKDAVPVSDIKDVKDLNTRERQGANISMAEEQLIKTIERAVKSLQGPQTTLEISIHEKTHDIMVKVLNKDTGELIREVPPEKTLDLVASMMEIAGILVDEKI